VYTIEYSLFLTPIAFSHPLNLLHLINAPGSYAQGDGFEICSLVSMLGCPGNKFFCKMVILVIGLLSQGQRADLVPTTVNFAYITSASKHPIPQQNCLE
jgi:hypothetical protein